MSFTARCDPWKWKKLWQTDPGVCPALPLTKNVFTPFIHTSMYILYLFPNDLLIRVGLALSAMCFQVFPQTACIKRCIVTTVALIWLYSTVHFQMLFQTACVYRGKVTMVAHIWLHSTVYFQVLFQTACVYRGIVTMVTFIWFYFLVRFQMEP